MQQSEAKLTKMKQKQFNLKKMKKFLKNSLKDIENQITQAKELAKAKSL
jgi:hypothetical protein